MKRRLLAAVLYGLFWIVFFAFARFFFLLTHPSEAMGCGAGTLALTFLHGIRLDISMAACFLVIPLILFTINIRIPGKWLKHFMNWYTTIFLFISSCLVVGDTILYRYWGYRMDFTALVYLDKPKEAAASVSIFLIIAVCLVVIFITILFRAVYIRIVEHLITQSDVKHNRLPAAIFFLLLTVTLIIPIRGGVGMAPISAGSVYFSRNMFANHSAVNVVWNVGSSVYSRKQSGNPYRYLDPQTANNLTARLLAPTGKPDTILNIQRPNILMVIMESFGSSLIGPLGGDSLTTPCLNRYISEGILFTRFYSSGNRTDKALPAILSGFPAQPAVSILMEPRKTLSLKSMTRILDSVGYSTSFWYGGDINFANINSYLVSTGFEKIISIKDFSASDHKSRWGIYDHILFNTLRDSMKAEKAPFFRVVLTLSSHEPFEIPVPPVFRGNDEPTKFRNSVHYTDKAIGDFLDWAKTTDWWENTLIILVADHCRRINPTDLVCSQSIFRIPMIWLGGALKEKGISINKTGDQVDIPLTLLHQLDLKGDFRYGKDLLSKQSNSFAFYSFNEGFAFITDTSACIYDHKLRGPVLMEGKGADEAGDYGKAYLEALYDDYLNR